VKITVSRPVLPLDRRLGGTTIGVFWTKQLSQHTIEKTNGIVLSKDTKVTFWRGTLGLLAIFALPLAGYFLPVAAIRLLFWIADGFIAKQQI
jgi:hypothetical protein